MTGKKTPAIPDGSSQTRPATPASTQPASGLLLAGRFGGAQGVRGEIRIRSFTEDPMALARYKNVYDASGARSFKIKKARFLKEGLLAAQIDGIDDRTKAETLTNLEIYIRRENLPRPDDDEFYIADLIGLEVRLADGSKFGSLTRVDNFGAGDILDILNSDGTEIQILFNKANVPQIDVTAGYLVINLPAEIEVREADQE